MDDVEVTSWQGEMHTYDGIMDTYGALQPIGVPHPRMWERLNSIYGEARATARALELQRMNAEDRRWPLTQVVYD